MEYEELPNIIPTANWTINYKNLYISIIKMKNNISIISKGLIIRNSICYNINGKIICINGKILKMLLIKKSLVEIKI